jgi:nucleoside-diphosphate-sugar epimerase
MTGKETFLVTGAMGCLGAWTVRVLAQEGAAVVAFDASADRSRFDLVNDGVDLSSVTFARGDIADRDALDTLLRQAGVTNVVHLAALQVPFCKADPVRGAVVNVVGTVNVFDVGKARRDAVRNVVYASSVAAFDAADADPETKQLTDKDSGRPSSHYGVYKQANEGTARVYWTDDGVPSVGVRPFVVYGPGRDQGLTSALTMAMLAAAIGRPYHVGYGGRIQLQYAPDVAALLVKASREAEPGAPVYNLGGPIATVPEVVAAIEAATGSKGITHADTRLPFPESVDDSGVKRDLGPVPETPLPEAVAATVDHFRRLHRDGRVPADLIRKLDSS